MIANEEPCQSQFEVEIRDLIKRLVKQADEHHMETRMQIQMIYYQQIYYQATKHQLHLSYKKKLAAIKCRRDPRMLPLKNIWGLAAIMTMRITPLQSDHGYVAGPLGKTH